MLDVHLEGAPGADEIRRAVASALGRAVDDVVVVDSDEGLADVPTGAVAALVVARSGQFKRSVSVFGVEMEEVAFAVRVAEELGCGCLVADATPNPYTWILVDAGGTRPVAVDAARLDEHEELVIGTDLRT